MAQNSISIPKFTTNRTEENCPPDIRYLRQFISYSDPNLLTPQHRNPDCLTLTKWNPFIWEEGLQGPGLEAEESNEF